MMTFAMLYVFLWFHEGGRAHVGLSQCGRVIYKGEEAQHSTPLHGLWETEDGSNTLVITFKYKSGSTQDEWIEHRFRLEKADGVDTIIYRDNIGSRVLVMFPDEVARGHFSRKEWWNPEEDTQNVIHLLIKGPEIVGYPAAEPTAMSMYKDKPITTWDVVKFFNRNNTAFCLKQEASYCLTIRGPTGRAFEAREGEVLQDVIETLYGERGGSVPDEVQEFDVFIKVGKRILEHAGYRADKKRRLKQLSMDQRLEILQKVHQRENAAYSGTLSSECQLVLRLPVWNPNP